MARYAVIDKDGKVVNHILIDDPLPKGYWPGYGAYLVPLEPVDTSNGGAGLDVIVFEKMTATPQIGDTLDIETGEVTKFVQVITQVDGIDVASAPDQKFTKDEEPKPDGGTVTPKEGSEPLKVVTLKKGQK